MRQITAIFDLIPTLLLLAIFICNQDTHFTYASSGPIGILEHPLSDLLKACYCFGGPESDVYFWNLNTVPCCNEDDINSAYTYYNPTQVCSVKKGYENEYNSCCQTSGEGGAIAICVPRLSDLKQ